MSVTFNRAQLINVANSALAAHERARVDYIKACDKYRADHARQHDNTAKLRVVRDWLTAQLKKGGPIAEPGSDILGGGNFRGLFYTPPGNYDVRDSVVEPDGLLSPAEAIETRSLLKVLEAATGDTVSAAELKLLGLKNLQPVFTAAAREAGK
ncbi:Uncharacterised protein [Mycobacteroides abscessus subsp. bolletii]|uniref:hypothetical protein n=1 Tax=Mycobacteroides abscessus TaxID=36809 RepID=UPI0009A6315E|nr:hypothetical protein [Mycobacteroides abscessus]SKS50808.1 Uncharacterised protein [Mycobacteroides abscessus subsp. bolletii]SKY55225.1 Uncharacterised protein [Mycobacteroides abscessus subsp. bolletii]